MTTPYRKEFPESPPTPRTWEDWFLLYADTLTVLTAIAVVVSMGCFIMFYEIPGEAERKAAYEMCRERCHPHPVAKRDYDHKSRDECLCDVTKKIPGGVK